MSEQDLITQARVVYEQLQDRALAATPLANMERWVTSGHPPPAAELRAFGFTETGAANAADLRLARKAFTRHWGFSIPCAEAIDLLSELAPLVEVGAGTGYWSAMLHSRGVDVIATDPAPRANPHGFETGRYVEVGASDAQHSILSNPGRSVLCSWPTQGEAWAAEAFSLLKRGTRLALVGTARGGITGDASLFDLLDSGFNHERSIELPQFPGVNDNLTVYLKV